MTPDEAIEIVADEIIADLLESWYGGAIYPGKQREDFPLIGEHDWERIRNVVESHIDYPYQLDQALKLLEGLASNELP